MDLNERLEQVALSLAGAGAIKDRLASAYCRYLSDLREQDFPASIRGDFICIFNMLHAEPAMPGEDVVRASIRKLSVDQLQICAERLVRLYGFTARDGQFRNGQPQDDAANSGEYPALVLQDPRRLTRA
ncbi:MAG: hypothetical protein QM718_02295 [Steroidobacteraceae bacterium]